MSQLELFDCINDHQEKYWAWKNANPEPFQLLRRFAYELLERKKRFGTHSLVERVRWEMKMTWHQDQGFKLNDHITPYLARDLIAMDARFADLIETRQVRGEE